MKRVLYNASANMSLCLKLSGSNTSVLYGCRPESSLVFLLEVKILSSLAACLLNPHNISRVHDSGIL